MGECYFDLIVHISTFIWFSDLFYGRGLCRKRDIWKCRWIKQKIFLWLLHACLNMRFPGLFDASFSIIFVCWQRLQRSRVLLSQILVLSLHIHMLASLQQNPVQRNDGWTAFWIADIWCQRHNRSINFTTAAVASFVFLT